MSAEDLLQIIRRQPFTPFRLVTTDGTGYDIHHPEILMLGRRALTIGVPDNPALPIYDQQIVVSMLHVQRLEPIPATILGNGQ